METQPQTYHPLTVFRQFLAATAILLCTFLWERIPQTYGVGSFLGHYSGSQLMALWPVYLELVVCLGLAGLSFTRWNNRLLRFWEQVVGFVRRLGWTTGLIAAGLALAAPYLRLSGFAANSLLPVWFSWLFGHLVLFGALCLHAAWPKSRFLTAAAAVLLLYGVVYRAGIFLSDLNTTPISRGWSEASRFYYASLFFARRLYAQSAPLPTLHPTRYLLQSLAFLIPGLPLWFHRLWQVLLWMGFTWAGGWALANRLVSSRAARVPALSRIQLTLLAGAWFFLFAFQGPVYYHLMACVILVLWRFDTRPDPRQKTFWISLGLVLLSSAWAGISRVNWFPVPGVLAVLLYVLEQPAEGKPFWKYWGWPVVWVASGLVAALFAQAVYAVISHNPLEQFSSSFTSDLLWYRLWPNATFGPGILNAVAPVTLLPLAYLCVRLLPRLRTWQPLRLLAVFAVLAVFFAGGIVVSVKIGGGSNLHNMDAFLVLLAVVTAYLALDQFIPDRPRPSRSFWAEGVLLALVIILPLLPLIRSGETLPAPAQEDISGDLARLQQALDQYSGSGKEILFITQRQLLTFQTIHGVKLVPEYEKVFLMEMAMSGNQAYLQTYQKDLQAHRFAAIISEPVTERLQDQTNLFPEENNKWVENINLPLLKYYQTALALPALQIVVLVPKQTTP